MAKGAPHREDFVRQRRNVIAISVVLMIAELVGIRFERISLLGNSFELVNPNGAMIALWVIYFYFLVRYYQYFRMDQNGQLRASYLGYLTPSLDAYVRHRIKNDAGGFAEVDDWEIASVKASTIRVGNWQRSLRGATARVDYFYLDSADAKQRRKFDISVSWWCTTRIRAASIARMTINTPLVTEYILPFVLAAGPVIIAVVRRV